MYLIVFRIKSYFIFKSCFVSKCVVLNFYLASCCNCVMLLPRIYLSYFIFYFVYFTLFLVFFLLDPRPNSNPFVGHQAQHSRPNRTLFLIVKTLTFCFSPLAVAPKSLLCTWGTPWLPQLCSIRMGMRLTLAKCMTFSSNSAST